MSEIIPCAGVLISNGNKVLLVKHLKGAGHIEGVYGIPAGRLADGEGEIECAIRELAEETGLVADRNQLHQLSKQYVAPIKRSDGSVKTFSLVVFVTTQFSGVLKDGDDTQPEWVDISHISEMNMLPNIVEIVHDSQLVL